MADPNNTVSVKATMWKNYLVAEILLAEDERKHSKILCDLYNDYMKGDKHYPKGVSSLFNYIKNYQGDRRNVEFISEELHFTNVASKKITEAGGDQAL